VSFVKVFLMEQTLWSAPCLHIADGHETQLIWSFVNKLIIVSVRLSTTRLPQPLNRPVSSSLTAYIAELNNNLVI
jgi:hypothetical protein